MRHSILLLIYKRLKTSVILLLIIFEIHLDVLAREVGKLTKFFMLGKNNNIHVDSIYIVFLVYF